MAGGNSNLRDSLLPALDTIRGIPGQLGLRLFTVSITKRLWAGADIGLGTSSDTTTGVKIDLGAFPVKIRNLSQRDAIASGGLYTDQDIEVGPITPPFAGSAADGDAISVFDPPVGTYQELFFNITGPGYSVAGDWFDKISQRTDRSFRYTFVLRKNGRRP